MSVPTRMTWLPPRMKGSGCSAVIIKLALPQPPRAHPSHSNNRVAGCSSPQWCLGHQMLQLPPMCMMTPEYVFDSSLPLPPDSKSSCLWDIWTSLHMVQGNISKTRHTTFPSFPPTISELLCSDSLPSPPHYPDSHNPYFKGQHDYF